VAAFLTPRRRDAEKLKRDSREKMEQRRSIVDFFLANSRCLCIKEPAGYRRSAPLRVTNKVTSAATSMATAMVSMASVMLWVRSTIMPMAWGAA